MIFKSSIAQIPSEDVRAALQEAFNEAAHNAYEPIYLLTGAMAILIIILSVAFHKQFKQDALEDDKAQSEG